MVLTSCNFFEKKVNGNGKVITQEQKLSSFKSIEASGSVKVHIRQDSSSSVKIETDENLLEYLDIHVTGDKLVVREKDGFNLRASKDIIIYTSAPVYSEVSVSGSGDIISDNIISGGEPLALNVSGSGGINVQVALPKVSAEVSGSGDIKLSGTSKEFGASISGSGSIQAFDLITDITTLEISGAANAEVTANQKLDVNVSGSGDVRYKGEAAVSQSISGAGSVKKVS